MKKYTKTGKALWLSLLCALNLAHATDDAQAEKLHEMSRAAKAGDVAALQTLAGTPPDQALYARLLCRSIAADNFRAFVALLDAGADAGYGERGVRDPGIHCAVLPPALRARYLEELLRRGVDVNTRNTLGETPLHSALGLTKKPFVQIEMVDMLLAAGADIHARDKYGKTVLFKAIVGGNPHRDWVMYFLEKGVDPQARSDMGYTFQFNYLYSTREMKGEGKRRRDKVRQWLSERGIPLESDAKK
ncbi:MAG: ankyrin repeat domain-containing protein [Cardiobacteriaceae bacterium]|nr:ankyrin repeat domain-containing protein [Cardiobacteriaceae bacterium]